MNNPLKKTGYVTDLHGRNETIEGILTGMKKVIDQVAHTTGALGRFTLIEGTNGMPVIINDGINIARNIKLEDKLEEMGANILIDSGNKISEKVGDNSSLVQILTYYIAQYGYDLLKEEPQTSPLRLKEGMEKSLNDIMGYIDKVKQEAKTKEDLINVAYISSRDKELSELVVEAIEYVGDYGIVNMDASHTGKTHLEKTSGMTFPTGFKIPEVTTKGLSRLNKPNIILINDDLERSKDIYPIIDLMLEETKVDPNGEEREMKEYLIISNLISKEVLLALIENIKSELFKKYIKVQVMLTPSSTGQDQVETLEDIRAFTGGEIINKQSIYKNSLNKSIFGKAELAILSKYETILKGLGDSNSESIKKRVETLKTELEDKKHTNTELKEHALKERIAKLSGGIATIKLHADTDIAEHDLRERTDDALRAVRSAKEEGIISGGGVVLKDIYKMKYNYKPMPPNPYYKQDNGEKILIDALIMPYIWILHNAEYSEKQIEDSSNHYGEGHGINVFTGEQNVNMIDNGVIDTALGLKMCLVTAITNAIMVLRLGSSITIKKEDKN